MSSGFYLEKCSFADAAAFWHSVMPVFRELVDSYDTNRDRVVAKYTEEQRRDDKMLNITVVDPHVEEYIKQFNMSHNDIIEGDYKNYATLEAFSMRVEDDGFEKMVDGYVRDGAKITIVLTYESSDDAIVRAVALARHHKRVNVFVRLNVDVPDAEQSKALLAERYRLSRIFPFGFRSGAGYGKCSTNLK